MYFNYLGKTSMLVDVGMYTSLGLTLLSAADYAFRMRRLIGDPGRSEALSCDEESRWCSALFVSWRWRWS